jgi:hypothetical protein
MKQNRKQFLGEVKRRRVAVMSLLSLLILPSVSLLQAQESDIIWVPNVTGEGTAELGRIEEARLLARAQVYAAALRRIGLEFQPELLSAITSPMRDPEDRRRSNDAFVSLLRMGGRGFVSDLRNVRWSAGDIAGSSTNIQRATARLLCDAKVVRSRGNMDPGFFITVHFDQDVFREGEKIGLEIIPSQECYLSVYQLAGDSIRFLFPRDGSGDTPFLPDHALRLPYSIETWQAALPEGWETAEDLVLVVARRDLPPLQSMGGGAQGQYATIREAFLAEILGELLSVAPSQTAIAVGRLAVARN